MGRRSNLFTTIMSSLGVLGCSGVGHPTAEAHSVPGPEPAGAPPAAAARAPSAAPPASETKTASGGPAAGASAAAASTACPEDMLLIDGEYCTRLEVKCLKSWYAGWNKKLICERF